MRHSPILLHDSFTAPGERENLARTLTQLTGAVLWTARFDPGAFPEGFFAGRPPLDMRAFEKYPELAKRSETACLRKCFEDFPASAPPLALFTGDASLMAWPRISGRRVFYCHTPPRLLFDRREEHLKGLPALERPRRRAFLWSFGRAWARAARSMDLIIAASQNAAHRLGEFLQLDSAVVPPPVDTGGFAWTGQGDYFLCMAEADGSQREDLLVEAFAAMPGERLVVASPDSGLPSLAERAKDLPNIELRERTGAQGLRELAGRCRAVLHFPLDEDFGPAPVWAMASGKPVIGVACGGVLEVAQDGRTGLLVRKSPSPGDVAEAVRAMTAGRALSMREACEERARRFGQAAFGSRILALLELPGA